MENKYTEFTDKLFEAILTLQTWRNVTGFLKIYAR